MLDKSKPPSLLRRIAIVLYDLFLLVALLFFATAILLPFNQGESFQPNNLLFTLYLLLVSFLFYAWFWIHGGQTLGLKTWKCRIVTLDGGKLSWKQAFIRYITGLLSWLFIGLGFVWVIFNKQRMTWHDLASKSRVDWSE